jgi:alcohol dehydrogenase class IV
MDTKIISFRTPHLILAGFGASERLGSEAKVLGAKKALLVTDKGVIESGTAKKIRDFLEKEDIAVEIFNQVIPDPDVACMEKCIEMAKRDTYDLILGVGGGRAPWISPRSHR